MEENDANKNLQCLIPMDRHVPIEVLTPFRLLHPLGFLLPAVAKPAMISLHLSKRLRPLLGRMQVFSKG
jgi:hypothetical protein